MARVLSGEHGLLCYFAEMKLDQLPLLALACAFLFSSASVGAEEVEYEIPVIDATETAKILDARGDLVKVRGVVIAASAIESGMNFLNFTTGRDSGFVAVVFPQDVAVWDGKLPSELYNGKLVEITGEIAIFKNNPQIVLRKPDQIEVLEDAPVSVDATAEAEAATTN